MKFTDDPSVFLRSVDTFAFLYLMNTSLTRTWFEEGYIESKIKMIEMTSQNENNAHFISDFLENSKIKGQTYICYMSKIKHFINRKTQMKSRATVYGNFPT